MPSHLGEKGKEIAKAAAISDGLVRECDIQGNDEADILAKKGIEMHDNNKHHAAAARDRKTITVATQKTMLHIWESYIEPSGQS